MGLMLTPGGRMFDTRTGRFLSRDQSAPAGADLYAGLESNPVNLLDPRGAEARSATGAPPANSRRQLLNRLRKYLGAQQADLKKLCVRNSGAIKLCSFAKFAAAVGKSGFRHKRTAPPHELRYVEGDFELYGALAGVRGDDYIAEECFHAVFYQSPAGRGDPVSSSQGFTEGKWIPLKHLWQDDAMHHYVKAVAYLLDRSFPPLEAELAKGEQCSPAKARRLWRGIIDTLASHQMKLGRAEQALASATGFSVDLFGIAKYYMEPQKNCGWPPCCGAEATSDLVYGEVRDAVLRLLKSFSL